MPKVNNIVSTAHAQQKELTALVGSPATSAAADLQAQIAELEDKLHDATVAHSASADQVAALTAELEAEKAAHAATKAALDAAVAAPVTTSGA